MRAWPCWLTAALSLLAASPAFAQATRGGAAGSSSAGGFQNGGFSSATGPGNDGDTAIFPTFGGGGGGAGMTGGNGGADSTGAAAGGTGAYAPGLDGGNGGNGSFSASGGGGGGGAHGAVVTTDTTNAATIIGTHGGRGGSTQFLSGGGGGAGGYGVVVDGSGITYTNGTTGAVSGARGGNGGAAIGNGLGGNGGDGGYGVFLTGTNVLINSGSITGGDGGSGGDATNSIKPNAAGDGGRGSAGIYAAGPATIINSGSITGGGSGAAGNAHTIAYAGTIGTAGDGIVGADLTIINSGTISAGTDLGAPTAPNAITFTGGSNVLELRAGSVITGNVVGTGMDTLRLGGSSDRTFDVSGIGPAAQYQGFSTFVKTGTSTWTLTGTTTAATPWSINQGTLAVSSDASLGAAASGISFDGGALQFLSGFTTNRAITLNSGGGTFDTNGNNATLAGDIGGAGGLTKAGLGTLSLTGLSSYTGATLVDAGVLQAGAAGAFASGSAFTVASGAVLDLNGFNQTIGSLAGSGTVTLGGATLTAGGDDSSTTFSGTMSGSGGLTKTGSGTLRLTGANIIYTGDTVVDRGVLDVEVGLPNTSAVTVNTGGTLTGSGFIGAFAVTINAGGVLAPGDGIAGSSMTLDSNLVMQAGSTYRVQLNPSTASFAAVSGMATLGNANVNAVFANGSYVSKTYTILTASGGISGTFAPGVTSINLPSNFRTSLSYDANDVYLNLILSFAVPSGLNRNQQAVGDALTDFFNRTGGIPAVYAGLTPAGLTQASGELGTASQQSTFDVMGRFIGLLTDPSTRGFGSTAGANGFADERAGRATDAFARLGATSPGSFEQRWSVWTAGLGGAQSTSGNAATGSNNATDRSYAVAVGADRWLSAQTLTGFALAGGGTNFGVNGLGSGRSDLFQAGLHLRHTEGPAFIAAALAYGWQDITTDRTVTISGVDRLRADFKANAWAGRLEGGYRLVLPVSGGIGLTPYAAAQVALFDQPAYTEQVVSGASTFALSYAGKRVTDSRSELGLRSDKFFMLRDGVLALRGRLAWAHDFNPDRSAAASFLVLPGASFAVSGAVQARDAALTTTSVEMTWASGWSAAGTFEGEFSAVTRAYAGKGVVRFAW